MPRYRRHFASNNAVFVTLVTGRRRRWLAHARDKNQLLQCMREVKSHRPFRHYGHVILDDHMHWLLQAIDGNSISTIVGALKQHVCHTRKSLGLPWRELWQNRFYDHIIRDETDFREHMDYIHFNPVRHGYASMARQWRWSSFNAWVERGMYSHCWGTKEPNGPAVAGEPGE